MLHTARKCRIEKQKWNLKENKFSRLEKETPDIFGASV